MAGFYQWQGTTLLLHCQLQPGARKDEIVGQQADRLKIRITAPPVDGKANQHLIHFIACQFGIRKSAITILRGHNSRQKTLSLEHPKCLPACLNLEA